MGLPNSMRDAIAATIVSGTLSPSFGSASAYLGVGDGTTAFSAAQTDLAGSNRARKAMDASYPQRTGNVITFRSTFATTDANWVWNEWGVFNAASSGTMLNRKVESLGTKSGGTWTPTVTFSFA